jgi:hypothetical protein
MVTTRFVLLVADRPEERATVLSCAADPGPLIRATPVPAIPQQ